MEDGGSSNVFGDKSILNIIARHIPSNELLKARLINKEFKCFANQEIDRRGSHIIHLKNDNEVVEFLKFLDQSDEFPFDSFKIPVGDIDELLVDQFVDKIGSKVKYFDLYEGYPYKPPGVRRRVKRNECEYEESYTISRDWKNITDTYGIKFEKLEAANANEMDFFNETKTMPKMYKLLHAACESLSSLSLRLKVPWAMLATKFPDKIPALNALETFNMMYDHMDGDFIEVYSINTDTAGDIPKFYKNIVEKAKNLKNGHIVSWCCSKSLLSEIGSIKFQNGETPSLETRFYLSTTHYPAIKKLMDENYCNRITKLHVDIIRNNVLQYLLGERVVYDEEFLYLLITLHKFILTQSKSLQNLSIQVNFDQKSPDYFTKPENLVFKPPRPLEPFSNLEVLEIYPCHGAKVKFLKGFMQGDYPVLKELYPYYDLEDPSSIEPPNITMPEELFKTIKGQFEHFKANNGNFDSDES